MRMLFSSAVAVSLVLAGCRSSILEDPTLLIPYSVPHPSHVTLTIENAYNTVVATLVDQDQLPGQYRVVLDMGGLQEGVYFYTVECKGLQSDFYSKSTRKILNLK